MKKGRRIISCFPYFIDGSLENLTFVSLARAHVRGGNQLLDLIDERVLQGPSSFLVKALITGTHENKISLLIGLYYSRVNDKG